MNVYVLPVHGGYNSRFQVSAVHAGPIAHEIHMTQAQDANSEYLLVLTTTPGSITAKKVANELVEKGVASCVQVLPQAFSVFRWKGRIEHEEEHVLMIKTAATCYQAVEDIIKAHHPYEVPEIVALPITGGLPAYLDWIGQTANAVQE